MVTEPRMVTEPTVYDQGRVKVNELSRSAIKIVDMLTILESGQVAGELLTQIQIDGLSNRLKSEANTLKTTAGEIKTLVS